MGIDISAKLIYGLPYADLPEEILDEVNEMIYTDELDYASPYYDAPRGDWIVGVECNVTGAEYLDLPNKYMDIPEILYSPSTALAFYVTPHVS